MFLKVLAARPDTELQGHTNRQPDLTSPLFLSFRPESGAKTGIAFLAYHGSIVSNVIGVFVLTETRGYSNCSYT
jgi:hypothetical protein